MYESPNKSLSRILMIVNMPLSAIGIGGLGMFTFMILVSRNSGDFLGALGSTIFTGLGLWLEYNYYKIAVREFEIRKEKIAWIISICYNTLILLLVCIGLVRGLVIGDFDNWYYGCLLLIYPGFFGWFSIVSLNKLRDFNEIENEFDQG